MIRTRTITDADGKPVEIEIEEYPPEHDCIEEAMQLLLLAKHIRDTKPPAWSPLTDYKPTKRKKAKAKDA